MNTVFKPLALTFFLTTSIIAQADIGTNLTLTSDYRYRGISQSNEEVAIQGGIDWFNDTGFYASIWASNVDFFAPSNPYDDDASVEFDVWAGYAGNITDQFSYDATLYYYSYPGDNIDQNFTELSLGLNYADFRLGYSYADDYLNLGLNNQYLEANYSTELTVGINLSLHLGKSFGEVYNNTATIGLDEYMDYSISLSKTFNDLDFSLTYMDTDIAKTFAVDSDHLANQDAVVFSINRTF
ncbi:MAG: TorF family putative porin [Amphritea sp.]|nr:TorF family putative porin [Amphritea sp.]